MALSKKILSLPLPLSCLEWRQRLDLGIILDKVLHAFQLRTSTIVTLNLTSPGLLIDHWHTGYGKGVKIHHVISTLHICEKVWMPHSGLTSISVSAHSSRKYLQTTCATSCMQGEGLLAGVYLGCTSMGMKVGEHELLQELNKPLRLYVIQPQSRQVCGSFLLSWELGWSCHAWEMRGILLYDKRLNRSVRIRWMMRHNHDLWDALAGFVKSTGRHILVKSLVQGLWPPAGLWPGP